MTPNTMDFFAHAQEWIDAWNSHDLERIMAHYADDVELVSPIVIELTGRSDGTVRGKAALRDYFARGLRAYPTLHFDFMRLYPGVRSCVVEYRSIRARCGGCWHITQKMDGSGAQIEGLCLSRY